MIIGHDPETRGCLPLLPWFSDGPPQQFSHSSGSGWWAGDGVPLTDGVLAVVVVLLTSALGYVRGAKCCSNLIDKIK